MSEWHADDVIIRRYLTDRLTAADAASVESHVMACGHCQHLVSMAGDAHADGAAADLDRTWRSIQASIDEPTPLPLERLLRALGQPPGISRIVAATNGQSWAWIVSAAALALLALYADATTGAQDLYLFTVVAPLVPLGAVALVYAPASDPLRELLRSTPMGTHGVLLRRTLVAVVGSLLIMWAVALATPLPLLSARWLLPSLALTSVSILLSAWIPATWGAIVLGGIWVAGAVISVAIPGPLVRHREVSLDRFVAFRPEGQIALALVLFVAIGLIVLMNDRFDADHQGILG